MSNDNRGYVYVLSNPSMPGILKIGRSKHGGQGRADTLYKNDTGVALPFELEFEIECEDYAWHENQIHRALKPHRLNESREFFSVSLGLGKQTIVNQLKRKKPKPVPAPQKPSEPISRTKSYADDAVILTMDELRAIHSMSSRGVNAYLSLLRNCVDEIDDPDELIEAEFRRYGLIDQDNVLIERRTQVNVVRVFSGKSE